MIKRIILLVLFSLLFGVVNNQQIMAQKSKTDQIVMLSGITISGKVLKLYSSEVRYIDEKTQKDLRVKRIDVEKIIYSNGRIRVINKPIFEEIKEDDYRMVFITENPSDVEGLFPIKEIIAKSYYKSRSAKQAKNSAELRMKKAAVKCKAMMVLLTNTEKSGGFGEPPIYTLTGTAYGEKPAEEEGSGN